MERLENETYEQYRSRRRHQQMLNKRSWKLFWLPGGMTDGTYTVKKYGPVKNLIKRLVKKSKAV